LPTAERANRRAAVLDAALAELLERGYPAVTMLGVARRAQASKETLYVWFGSREGLMEALVERNADRTADHVREALDHDADPVEVLVRYAEGLLSLLVSAGSVALNRAAASSPDLAAVLLRAGRHRVGTVVEEYLAGLHARGVLDAPDAAAAFRLLYGLTVQDTQIRVLLGEPPPPPDVIAARSREAVTRFLRLSERAHPLVTTTG
jgi:AcrR family transcriptional regulator